MRPESFHEALRAAARIACVAGLVGATGCRPESTTTASSDANPTPPVTPPESEPTPLQATTDPAALPTDGSPPSPEALRACENRLTVAFSQPNTAKTPENQACCTAIVENDSGSAVYWTLHGPCCEMLDFGPVACSPWGPPTPPAMVPRSDRAHPSARLLA